MYVIVRKVCDFFIAFVKESVKFSEMPSAGSGKRWSMKSSRKARKKSFRMFYNFKIKTHIDYIRSSEIKPFFVFSVISHCDTQAL